MAWWLTIPIVAREIVGSSGSEISLLVTAMSVAGAVFGIPLSRLVTRLGTSGLWTIGVFRVVVVGVTLALLFGFPKGGFWILLVASIVMGGIEVSHAMTQQITVSLLFARKNVVSINGRLTLAQSLSQVVGAAGFGAVLDRINPVFGFLIDAMLNLFGMGAAKKVKSCARGSESEGKGEGVGERSGMWVIRRRGFVFLLVAALVMRFFLNMSVAVQSAYMVTDLLAGAAQLGFAFAIGSIGGVLTGFFVSRWGERISLKVLMRVGSLMVAAPQLLILIATPGWGVLMVGVANMFSGIGASLFSIASISLRQRKLFTSELGAVAGVFASLGNVVGILGSLLGASLAFIVSLKTVLVISVLGLAFLPVICLRIAAMEMKN
nr:MFS transporter [[Pseudopropionibacterium] massiliense]